MRLSGLISPLDGCPASPPPYPASSVAFEAASGHNRGETTFRGHRSRLGEACTGDYVRFDRIYKVMRHGAF